MTCIHKAQVSCGKMCIHLESEECIMADSCVAHVTLIEQGGSVSGTTTKCWARHRDG